MYTGKPACQLTGLLTNLLACKHAIYLGCLCLVKYSSTASISTSYSFRSDSQAMRFNSLLYSWVKYDEYFSIKTCLPVCRFTCLLICRFASLHLYWFAGLHANVFAGLQVWVFAGLHASPFVCLLAYLQTELLKGYVMVSVLLSPVGECLGEVSYQVGWVRQICP